jgi:hypothetical protein
MSDQQEDITGTQLLQPTLGSRILTELVPVAAEVPHRLSNVTGDWSWLDRPDRSREGCAPLHPCSAGTLLAVSPFPSCGCYCVRVAKSKDGRRKEAMIKTLMANPLDFGQRYWREVGLVVLLMLVLVLAAHAAWPRTTPSSAAPAATAGSVSTAGWSRLCVGGVSYLQFASGVTAEWTPAGRVRTCTPAK